MTIKFEVGKTYLYRSSYDGDESVSEYTIKSRTDKTIMVEGYYSESKWSETEGVARLETTTVRRGLSVYKGIETFEPDGSYSMCAVVFADNIKE